MWTARVKLVEFPFKMILIAKTSVVPSALMDGIPHLFLKGIHTVYFLFCSVFMPFWSHWCQLLSQKMLLIQNLVTQTVLSAIWLWVDDILALSISWLDYPKVHWFLNRSVTWSWADDTIPLIDIVASYKTVRGRIQGNYYLGICNLLRVETVRVLTIYLNKSLTQIVLGPKVFRYEPLYSIPHHSISKQPWRYRVDLQSFKMTMSALIVVL
jgi:hypothetical protein